jgi:hypothetical protein
LSDKVRDTSIKFEEREPEDKKLIQFQVETEWAEEFTKFCKEASVSKSAFLRYAAWKEMQNYLRSA